MSHGPPTAERHRRLGNRTVTDLQLVELVDRDDDMTKHTLDEVTAVDAERAFLGTCLAGAPDAVVALPTLSRDDFTDPRHARVFDALLSLHEQGVGLDPVLVLAELRNLGHVDRWGDAPGVGPFLYDLLQFAMPSPSAPYCACLLQEATARRRVQVLAGRLAQAARSSALDDVKTLVADEFAAVCQALNRVLT